MQRIQSVKAVSKTKEQMSQQAKQEYENQLEMRRIMKERRQKSMEAMLQAHNNDIEMKKRIAESRFNSKIQRVQSI